MSQQPQALLLGGTHPIFGLYLDGSKFSDDYLLTELCHTVTPLISIILNTSATLQEL